MGKDSKRREKDKKKDKHKSSKSRRVDGEGKRSTTTKRSSDLAKLLSWGLLAQPKLLGELPSIISALDASQSINISGISNDFVRVYLTDLIQLLPVVQDESNAWSKKMGVKSISGFILNELLKVRAIVQPTDLSSSQQKSSRIAPGILQELLSSFRELTAELPLLLQKIVDGDGVQLGTISNSDVREKLCSLVEALGAEEDDEGAHSLGTSSDVNKEAFQHFLNAFSVAQAFRPLRSSQPDVHDRNAAAAAAATAGKHSSGAGGSSSSEDSDNQDSGSSDSDSGSDDESDGLVDDVNNGNTHASKRAKLDENGSSSSGNTAGLRSQGPSMPSAAQLEAARQAAERYNPAEMHDEDDSDDDIGPAPRRSLPTKSPAAAAAAAAAATATAVPVSVYAGSAGPALPIGVTAEDLADLYANRQSTASEGQQGDKGAVDPNVREEWMLTPGEDHPIAGFESFGTSRKFQAGKQAVKKAAALVAMREDAEKEDNSEAAVKSRELMEQYKQMRGPSLMESHAESMAKLAKPVRTERRPFDRELDVLSRRTMDSQQMQALVEKSKELDSRFSKGALQKSFL